MRHVFLILTVWLVSLTAGAQYIEEIGSLESNYEVRARSVLNTILRPTDYTLVVSVELDRDEKKLREYQEEVQAQYLPGMPLMGEAPALPGATNKLHEMKAKTDIHVVLSRNVNADVEKVIKDLLVSKLHLDSGVGDSVTIKRIELPSDPKIEPEAPLFPELSWKMWTLIVILSLLALSGLMFWAWRRSQAKDPAKDVKEIHGYNHNEDPKPEPPVVAAEPAQEGPPSVAIEAVEMDIESVRQHLISIATSYPQLSSKALSEYCLRGNAVDLAMLMEFIGWDVSKKIFTDIPAVAWARIGQVVKNRGEAPQKPVMEKAVRQCYKIVLADYIEQQMDEDQENPFMFVLKMKSDERALLLEKESAINVAILCLNAPTEVTAEIISGLAAEKKSRVLSEIARIEKLPQEAITAVVGSFKQRIEEIKSKPELRVEGASLLGKVIRGMSPEEEMDILTLFENENPEELERIRRVVLVFSDLKLIGTDMLSDALESFDVDTVYAALFRVRADLQQSVLKALPQKKGMLVERELSDAVIIPQKQMIAKARREICQKVEDLLALRSIELSDLIDGNVKMTKSA